MPVAGLERGGWTTDAAIAFAGRPPPAGWPDVADHPPHPAARSAARKHHGRLRVAATGLPRRTSAKPPRTSASRSF